MKRSFGANIRQATTIVVAMASIFIQPQISGSESAEILVQFQLLATAHAIKKKEVSTQPVTTPPPTSPGRERNYRDYSVPNNAWNGYMSVGLPGQFGQFCGGVMNGMSGAYAPRCGYGFPCQPVPPPCGGYCGGPVALPHPVPSPPPCMGMSCGYGGGYGFGGGGYVGGGIGFGLGEMSSDAQIVWGAAFGFSSLATFVEPRAYPSQYQTYTVLDPYFMGSRIVDHTPRPPQ